MQKMNWRPYVVFHVEQQFIKEGDRHLQNTSINKLGGKGK